MNNYETLKERLNKNKESKAKLGYCNAIIFLSGKNINSIKEEELMILEARLNAYEEVFKKRRPNQPITLENKEVSYWREIIEKRYIYLNLIEEGKLIERALYLETGIQQNIKSVQLIKQANKMAMIERDEIMDNLILF